MLSFPEEKFSQQLMLLSLTHNVLISGRNLLNFIKNFSDKNNKITAHQPRNNFSITDVDKFITDKLMSLLRLHLPVQE